MKLIELYLDEIRQQLPPHNREDILKEIRSTLMDTLDDRMGDKPPTEADIIAVLRDFGSPRQVALQYGAQRYLIGPRLFHTYLNVLRIVLLVIAGLNIFGVVIAVINQTGFDSGFLTASAELVGGLLSTLFTGFGIVTLSFAGVERSMPENWKVEISKTWNPEDLLGKEDLERVKIAELAVEITASLAFIIFINFFLHLVGIYYVDSTGWQSTPILTEAFVRYVPWITIYTVLNILLDLYLIRNGYWDKLATIGKIVINGFQIAVAIAMIIGPVLIAIDLQAGQVWPVDLSFTDTQVNRTLNILLDVVLGFSIFGLIIDSIKRLYRHFIKGTHANIEINA